MDVHVEWQRIGGIGIVIFIVVVFLGLVTASPRSAVADDGTQSEEEPTKSDEPKSAEAPRTRTEFLAELERRPGLLDVYYDHEKGRAYLDLPPPRKDGEVSGEIGRYLYLESLRGGLGSNPVGLDRGQLGPSRVLIVRRLGRQVLFEVPNLAFRAVTDRAAEREAVRQSFASSVLWGRAIEAVDPDGRSVVDITTFLVRDAHGVATTLEASGEGDFSLDLDRSAVDPAQLLAFPDNLEFEAVLTFGGRKPGREVRSTAPDPTSVTLIQHHSFIRLPDDGYRPRVQHVRSGAIDIGFSDYAAPLDRALETRYVIRHRLEKKHPDRPMSPPKEPIVYYVDHAAPEPVKQALIEGAWWWLQAFQAAGFEDAYEVRELPEDAHPLDVRYNVIQWVHRATRGWSYGASVIDPRTGEIIKGHVSLGSLRVRQDRRIFEGLWGTAATGTGQPNDPVEVALARLRQLSAHEVGHTLGLTHNFAASTYGRASVMDYPAPLLRVKEGEIDASDAYSVGLGDWDVHAMRYLYTEFTSPEAEREGLAAIVDEGRRAGYVFLTDSDARPAGGSDARAALWDNGADPIAELDEVIRVRELAISRFAEDRVRTGRPLTELRETFVPVYLYHRYQVEAVIKLIGGVEYEHRQRGDGGVMDGERAMTPVPIARQQAALSAVASTLAPEFLMVPESVRSLLVPRAPGTRRGRELFPSEREPHFDPTRAATAAVEIVLDLLLDEARCARLVALEVEHERKWGLTTVLEALLFGPVESVGTGESEYLHAIVRRTVAHRLMEIVGSATAPEEVRAVAFDVLERLHAQWTKRRFGPAEAVRDLLEKELRAFIDGTPWPEPRVSPAPTVPPGSPIGTSIEMGALEVRLRTGRASGLIPEWGRCGCPW